MLVEEWKTFDMRLELGVNVDAPFSLYDDNEETIEVDSRKRELHEL